MATDPADISPHPPAPLHRAIVIIGLAAAAVMAWQFSFPGFYHVNNDDAGILQKYVPQIAESIGQGVLYPRWMQEDFKGYGSPIFIYYSPLLYYLCSLSSLAGLSLPLSAALLKLIGLWLGGVFLFLFLRDPLGKKPALIAALCYVALPTRLLDLYYLNSPAGRFAQAWMPMLLYYTKKTVENPLGRKHIAGMGFSYAALIMTHLATAYIFTPFVVAYGLLGAAGKLRPAVAARLLLGLGAGALVCAVYFLPVLLTRGLVHIEYMGGEFLYFRNYLFYVLQRPDGEPLWLVQGNVILLELCLAALFYYPVRRRLGFRLGRETRFFFYCLAVCIFLMSSLSGFVWRHVPGLATVQFPYRFTPVYLFFFSAMSGAIINAYMGWAHRPRGFTLMAAAMLIIIMTYDAALVARSDAYSAAEAEVIAGEFQLPAYLPKTVSPRALGSLGEDDPMLSSDGEFTSKVKKWDSFAKEFTVDSPGGVLLRVKTFFFPGWRAWVDGNEVPIGVEGKTGAMLIDVSPGRHEVKLRFANTPIRTAGAAVSAFTLMLLVFPYGAVRRRTKKGGPHA